MKRNPWDSTLLTNIIRRVSIGIPVVLIAALTLLLSTTVACNSSPQQSLQNQPSATDTPAINAVTDGAKLLDERCSSCHSANKPKQARKTLDQWDQTVNRMIGKGARLTETEKAILLECLGKTYGP